VGATGQPFLQLAVDQLDIGRIRVGQQVFAKLDLTGTRVFSAHVAKIYPTMNTRDQSFRVDAELADTTTGFPSQFILAAVEANIVLAERQNALVIPKEALQADKTVLVFRDGKEQSVSVQLGLQNAEEVEVISGLQANDQLLAPKE
jgi:HlyD family secretion protein